MRKIKNLLFDLGNVLFDLDEEATRKALKEVLAEGEFPADIPDAIRGYDTGNWSTERFLNFFLRRAKPDIHARDVVQAWNLMMLGIRPEVLTLLEDLNQKYELYLLSNNNELHYDWFLKHLEDKHGLTDFNERFFNKAYYSHLIGYRKPDRICYEWVLNDAGIIPEETLFIDDKIENTSSAGELGLKTITLENSFALSSTLLSEKVL